MKKLLLLAILAIPGLASAVEQDYTITVCRIQATAWNTAYIYPCGATPWVSVAGNSDGWITWTLDSLGALAMYKNAGDAKESMKQVVVRIDTADSSSSHDTALMLRILE